MVRRVVKDILFLGQKSQPATKADEAVAQDLLDTLAANAAGCVGMAANMIGVRKNIIAVTVGVSNLLMYNPVIVKKSGPYQTEEGCLSLPGTRPTARYEAIEVTYQDKNWQEKRQKFTGWTAQIIQHEIDHLSGKII